MKPKMTNREKLRNMSDEELGKLLCDYVSTVTYEANLTYTCEICPARTCCSHGNTGFIVWLKEEAEEE